tara:strand:+ start:687 stop:878 length:192 start_codon:yes stop_codon:yes gene_type:complete
LWKRVLGKQSSFTLMYKTPYGRCTSIQRFMEIRISTTRIRNTKEKTGGKPMKEIIDWQNKLKD